MLANMLVDFGESDAQRIGALHHPELTCGGKMGVPAVGQPARNDNRNGKCCSSRTRESPRTPRPPRRPWTPTRHSAVSGAPVAAGVRSRRAAGPVIGSMVRSRGSTPAAQSGILFLRRAVAHVAATSGNGHHAFTASSGRCMSIGTSLARVGTDAAAAARLNLIRWCRGSRHARSLPQFLVDDLLEAAQRADRALVVERELLHHVDAADLSHGIDPELGVEEAG